MIDLAKGWFEMAQIPNKTAAEIADITEKTWFTRYPLPQRIVFDRGTDLWLNLPRCVTMTMA